jgi:hypothetical protein
LFGVTRLGNPNVVVQEMQCYGGLDGFLGIVLKAGRQKGQLNTVIGHMLIAKTERSRI